MGVRAGGLSRARRGLFKVQKVQCLLHYFSIKWPQWPFQRKESQKWDIEQVGHQPRVGGGLTLAGLQSSAMHKSYRSYCRKRPKMKGVVKFCFGNHHVIFRALNNLSLNWPPFFAAE